MPSSFARSSSRTTDRWHRRKFSTPPQSGCEAYCVLQKLDHDQPESPRQEPVTEGRVATPHQVAKHRSPNVDIEIGQLGLDLVDDDQVAEQPLRHRNDCFLGAAAGRERRADPHVHRCRMGIRPRGVRRARVRGTPTGPSRHTECVLVKP